ncbi:hypothetical protein RRG08_047757 [Elysia crispata]|uniref:Uncharacterized protein n=1 Tax=Elysia crispata TaxID=231223 RepID=A0AAE1DSB0_9GAST|nr:hypothetical protein RRG08_047757 [Elysia crispata]
MERLIFDHRPTSVRVVVIVLVVFWTCLVSTVSTLPISASGTDEQSRKALSKTDGMSWFTQDMSSIVDRKSSQHALILFCTLKSTSRNVLAFK